MADAFDRNGAPYWLWKTKRLFPHPIFAGLVSLACLALTVIFAGVTVFERIWFAAPICMLFLGGTCATAAAAVSEVKDRRSAHADPPDRTTPAAPTFAIIVLMISVFAWMLTVGLHWFGAGLRNGPGNHKYWMTVAIAVISTIYTRLHGQRVIRQHFGTTGGRSVNLTGQQAFCVALFVVGFGIYLTWLTI